MKKSDVDLDLMQKLVALRQKQPNAVELFETVFHMSLSHTPTDELTARTYLERLNSECDAQIKRINGRLLQEFDYEAVTEEHSQGRGFLHVIDADATIELPETFHALTITIHLYVMLSHGIKNTLDLVARHNIPYLGAVSTFHSVMLKQASNIVDTLRYHHTSLEWGTDVALYDAAAGVRTRLREYPRTRAALEGRPLEGELPGAVAICLAEAEAGRQFDDIVNRVNRVMEADCPVTIAKKNHVTYDGIVDNMPVSDGTGLDPLQELLLKEEVAASDIMRLALSAALTPIQLEIYTRYQERQTYQGIADSLGSTVSTVKMHLQAARRRLKKSFG